MHYPEIENQILADEVSLPNDAISHKYMHNTENTITPETDIQRLADMHGDFA